MGDLMNNRLEQDKLLDEMNVIVFLVEADMTVVYGNKALLEFSGITLDDVKGIPVWELPMWQNNKELQHNLMFTLGHIFSLEEATRMDAIAINSDGDSVELDLQLKPIIEDGKVVRIMGIGYNITELVKAKTFLTKRERQIGAFFKYSTQGYFFQMLPVEALIPDPITVEFVNQVYDAQNLETLNKQVIEYIGLDTSLEYDEHFDIVSQLGISESERISIWIEMISTGIASRKVELLNHKTKNKVFLELKFVAIKINEDSFEGNFCIVSNITQEYVYEKELSFLANKDSLTGLNNRRNFKRLASAMLKDSSKVYTAAMMDIDKFKAVNDTYGHDVGDIAIRSAADIIESVIGNHGVTGRYGGEEFIILLKMDAVETHEILEEVRIGIEHATISYGAGNIKLTISGGCCSFEQTSDESLDQAIIHADQALLEAKKTGRNKVITYNDELHGIKAIDKLTGTYTKNALLYKHTQFHDNLRKSDIFYGIVIIRLNTLVVSQLEILNQYVKQIASMLNSMLRDHDIVGRYDDMTFVVLVHNVDQRVVRNIKERIVIASKRLSEKFDNLVEAHVSEAAINDWSLKIDDIYDDLNADTNNE